MLRNLNALFRARAPTSSLSSSLSNYGMLYKSTTLRCAGYATSSASETEVKVDMKLLAKLRKETGVSMGKCKEALKGNGNDYEKSKR